MLAIQTDARRTSSKRKVCPNVLPCAISHNGPVNASKRYWNPQRDTDGVQTAYFRGRKLRGRKVLVPDGYRGVILNKTDRVVQEQPAQGEVGAEDGHSQVEEDDDEQVEDVMALDELADFDSLTVWRHEAVPDEKENPFSRVLGEWVRFAEAMHSYEPQAKAGSSV